MHDLDELLRLGNIKRDKKKVVDQTKKEAVVRLQEGQLFAFQVGIKIVAEERAEDRALWDTILLSIKLLAYSNQVLPDVRRDQVHQVDRAVDLLENALKVDGVVLVPGDLGGKHIHEGDMIPYASGIRAPPLGKLAWGARITSCPLNLYVLNEIVLAMSGNI